MSVAYLYPGQGFEEPQMARNWLDDPLLALASEETGTDVRRAIERFLPELFRTEVLQPTLVAVALAADRRVRAVGPAPRFVAGHSIGELAAWAASGAIDAEDAVRLAARRGAAMALEARSHPGGMVSLDEAVARSLDPAAFGLALAARNSPFQTVWSGPAAAVARLEARGARRLRIAGAWHSPAMDGARGPFEQALRSVHTRVAATALVTCLDGSIALGVPELVAQLTRPVAWSAVMGTLARAGVTDFVAMGCARTLRGLVRDNGLRARVWPAESLADLDALARHLGVAA